MPDKPKPKKVKPNGSGKRWAASWLEHLLSDACKSADVVYGRKKPGGIVFHDTRHTAATRMLHAGMDPDCRSGDQALTRESR